MIHAEYLGGNPLTGRKVWLVRHIIGNKFGDPWDWSVIVVKSHHLSRTALVKGAMELSTYSAHRALQGFLADMGFAWAEAHRRNGVLKRYRLQDAFNQGDAASNTGPTTAELATARSPATHSAR